MSELESELEQNKEIPVVLEDQDFIKSSHARPLRILGEYLHPGDVLKKENITDTVVFFGSARIPPPQDLSDESTKLNEHAGLAGLSEYYRDAMLLSKEITLWSKGQNKKNGRSVRVCTGGGPGIMEAANRGASLAKGESIGLNILLPHEQHCNPYISPHLNFNFQYFFMRKYWFLYYARVLIAFPGGFGTMDELFETLTLRQTGIIDDDIVVLLYGKEFWESTVNFKAMAQQGLISEEDLGFFTVVDSVSEAMEQCMKILQQKLKG